MIWHPYTQMKNRKTPHRIIKAKGVYLHTENKVLIDSISSWWCMIHGYSHPEMNRAGIEQMEKFSHVMLAGLTHEPVEKLTAKLKEILPKDLDYAFYSDSGSVGVEVALKMAIQFYNNRGQKNKKEIIALKEAYHGDTFKAMAVGDDEDYHQVFSDKEGVYHIDIRIESLERMIREKHQTVAALLVEPLLQGAAGMKMYDVSFLERARELCDEFDILLIFDEVVTGFGRTGRMFVADCVCPDIIVLGKALTGGYMGHAATIVNKRVYQGFYSDDPSKAFMHGPTFMGNALACTMSLKSIEIFLNENYMEKIKGIEKILKKEMKNLQSPQIKEIRVMGACACIEVYDPSVLEGFGEFAYERGIWNRPFLSFMYTMPPYIIREDELIEITNTFKAWFEKMEA
jgi:adenosylmethionine-8-amino-7-oxononanoate aminotransferase